MKVRTRFGLRSSGSLTSIEEVTSEVNVSTTNNTMETLPTSSRPQTPTPTPTVSTLTTISTNLKPTDLLAFIDQLPTYEGPPNNLDQFIDSGEEISNLFRGADQTPYGVLLMRAIRNQIKGKAHEALTLARTRLEWDHIKGNLRNTYVPK